MKKTTLGIIILLAIAMTLLVGCGHDALKNDAKKVSIDTTEAAEDKTLPRVDPDDVYAAYYGYLIAHESAITSCQQDLIYAGGGESYARNILVADINSDGIDDLLCVLKEGGDDCDTKLRILSYDGEIRMLLEQDYLVNVGGGTKYAWMLLPDGSLASVRTSNGDNLAYFFTKYEVDTDGKLVPASKLCTKFEQDGSQKFFVDDKLADESDFARELRIYQAKDLSLILKTGAYDYDSFFAFYAGFDPIAMTFADALEFLQPSAEIVDLDKYLGEWIYHGENDMEGRLTVKDANGLISCDLQFYRLIGDQFSAYPISDTSASIEFCGVPGTISFEDGKITIKLEDNHIYNDSTVSQFLFATEFAFERQ